MKVRQDNPFHPQFGRRPDLFIGRDDIIRDFIAGLDNLNDPYRTTVVTGIRGSGKTALLAGIKERIDPKRYAVVDVTVGNELNQSIIDQLQLAVNAPQRRVTGASVGALGFGIGMETSLKECQHGFRYYLSLLVEELAKHKKGVVFLVDEVHNAVPDTREFVTSYQHLVRDKADVALLMAGLPQAVNSVLNDRILTFMHRANKIVLDCISLMLVRHLYKKTFTEVGFTYTEGSLELAADATFGFPYLIQLIGYYIWNSGCAKIDEQVVEEAVLNSKADLYKNVYQLMLRESSARDQDYLFAMLEDENATSIRVLSVRVGASAGTSSRYRERLIEGGFVVASARGYLKLAPPYFKEFLALQYFSL